ncbi:hypothetical protein KHA80_03145 [Anaerobacillus sp. HL2]|nr:hypothetical protein KHA80_03145 [Anaerobacillus sp. HL2]
MDLKEFGRHITQLRIKSGYKANGALWSFGIAPATLSRIESGIQEAKPPTLKKRFAPFLKDVTYEELMIAVWLYGGGVCSANGQDNKIN